MSERVGRYELVERLAVGGMGEVFLARDAERERDVVLKRLLPGLADLDDFEDQFMDEARLAARLRHDNIVRVLEVGRSQGDAYIVMEHVDGATIAQLQRSCGGPLPPAAAARVVRDAARGLAFAHGAKDDSGRLLGVIHRDVSPQNLMVDRAGHTRVLDFGIARARHRLAKTQTGMLKGKVPYMSPEQATGDELDARSDAFSLGVVLWEMLAGERLFAGNDELEVLRQVVRVQVRPLSEVVDDTPPALLRVLDRLLARSRGSLFRPVRGRRRARRVARAKRPRDRRPPRAGGSRARDGGRTERDPDQGLRPLLRGSRRARCHRKAGLAAAPRADAPSSSAPGRGRR